MGSGIGLTDAELIEASRGGDVAAFAKLVERYQALVCAVSFSATGDRALSEDVSQETFVAVWRGLDTLREPSKLRAWLCGIARNLSSKARERSGREVPDADTVGAAADDATPLDTALDKEAEALVWSALREIPDAYREPLVLFYREGRSVKQVAAALGLSENAIEQRLSRGRQYLKQGVADLVETTLERTRPSTRVVAGVLAMIAAGAGLGTAEASPATPDAGSMAGRTTAWTFAVATGALVVIVIGAIWLLGSRTDTTASAGAAAPGAAQPTPSRLERLRRGRQADDRPTGIARAQGRVIDAGTRRGIAGARITFTDTTLDGGATREPGRTPSPVTATTGDDGRWVVSTLVSGDYVVSATADGYLPASVRDVSAPTDALEIALGPGGRAVTGTITDIGGGPIAGAQVSFVRLDQGKLLEIPRAILATTAGDTGRYQLSLEDGTYLLQAIAAGYAAHTRIVMVERAGQIADATLVPGAVIEGQVVERGSGEPVAGAYLVVSADSSSTAVSAAGAIAASFRVGTVITDDSGRFRLDGLDPGIIEITARAPGFASRQPTELDVAIGEELTGVQIEVAPAHTVSGFVVAPGTQQPIAGALVSIERANDSGDSQAAAHRTGPDGHFEIIGVLPGRYAATAMREGLEPAILASPLSVDDRDVDDVVIELAEGARVAGRVIPAGRATLSLRLDVQRAAGDVDIQAALGAELASRDTDDRGQFELAGVPDGRYRLVATTATGLRATVPLDVDGASQTGLAIALSPMGRIEGVVVDEQGKPMADLRIRVTRHESAPYERIAETRPVWTDRAGRFAAIGLQPGTYNVSVHAGRFPAVPVSWAYTLPRADSSEPWAATVCELGERDSRAVTLRVVRSRQQLRGVVLGPDGKPLADAWVSARWLTPDGAAGVEEPELEGPTLTARDGSFVLDRLRAGRYVLTASHARSSARAKVEVATGGNATVLRLAPPGSVSGRVTWQGQPVDELELELIGPTPRRIALVEAGGAFRFDRLSPGRYEVHATARAGVVTRFVDVRPGETAALALELAGWGSISGLVVAADTGEPIAGASVLAAIGATNAYRDPVRSKMLGHVVETDAAGRFRIERLDGGRGTLFVGGEMPGSPIGSAVIELVPGTHRDLGTIRAVVLPPPVPPAEQGRLGVFAYATVWPTAVEPGDNVMPSVDPADRIVRVVDVEPPARDAGISVGDQIVSVNGFAAAAVGPEALLALLLPRRQRAGDRLVLELRRGDTTFSATLVAAP